MMIDAPQRAVRPYSVNLFITDLCNRKCPFCYLHDWVTSNEGSAGEMSLKDLGILVRWLKESGISRVKLAGGEPLLHSDLVAFLKDLLRNGIVVDAVLTNGLGKTELYEEISKITDTNWLVNVANPESYTDQEWDLLNRNLETLRWKNEGKQVKVYGFDTSSLRHLCLSITFYEQDQDYDYIIELAKKYKCPVIRYDISRPASSKSNIYVDFDSLVSIKPMLMDFVKRCVHEGIKPGLDCALPLCVYTQEDLVFLSLFSNFYSVCTPHLDVMPDLTVKYCTSMREILPSIRIEDKTATEIFYELFSQANKYREYQPSRCRDCHNYLNKLCQGYCLRLKWDLLKKEEKPDKGMRSQVRWPRLRR